jgi:glycine reductase
MKLELATFPVHEVAFGSRTMYRDGRLEVNREEILAEVRLDSRLLRADLEIVHPGDSVRITRFRDILEPRVKVAGPGVAYPGVCDRPVITVGRGRTHRLAGVSVIEVADVPLYDGNDGWIDTGFIDMSGPGASATPFGSLINLCLVMDVRPELHREDQNDALHRAALLVQERLAATTTDLAPPEVEIFSDEEPVDPSVPRVVNIMSLRSPQHYSGSLTAFWTSIYGMSRLTPPWLLHPNEVLDTAVSIHTSWIHANNPVVLGLARRHRKELNFLGVIAIRTRWSAQDEKDITSLQAAKLASMLRAQGALVTFDSGGNDFMEVIRTVQECEHLGVKTVFMTSEEDPSTQGPPLLEPLPEADAIVSTGIGRLARSIRDQQPLPAVARVIGALDLVADGGTRQGTLRADGPLPGARFGDPYGFGRQSCFQY